MKNKKRGEVVNGVEVEVYEETAVEEVVEEVAVDDEEQDMEQEAAAAEDEEALGDAESDEDDSEEDELGRITTEAWKEARAKLKAADEAVSYSIDDYPVRKVVDALKRRYNAKERTPALFKAIHELKFIL
jgi:hypothetical protein